MKLAKISGYMVLIIVCVDRGMYNVPVSTDVGVVGDLVVVHPLLTLPHESVLLTVGPNAGYSHEGLLEVRVDRGTSD